MEAHMRIIIATGNNDKVREIDEILQGTGFEAVSMKSLGLHPDIVEDADSFRGNALKKAMAVHELTKEYVMADDSGLCIDALDGAPGIYSSRFCGEDSTYEEKFKKIFELLKDVPEEKRTAHFTCAIAVVRPDGSHFTVEEYFNGVLHEEPAGENGFGYDPIFFVPEYNMTSAQMTPAMKHSMSHRGKALRAMVEKLTEK
ncbi:MAG: RdgB/HAM1 family non-canonical purine NTP pyrophosphatase [Clostridiales bacterium]|nr:RdgB/HAM1 family non-canonical purine NTP pyrophosphatase [Clostridiales bacterium]HAW15444.1 non-canonical purine NTP pyrophosphatase, RdgB/HAM1 family [Clostridiales bacterium]